MCTGYVHSEKKPLILIDWDQYHLSGSTGLASLWPPCSGQQHHSACRSFVRGDATTYIHLHASRLHSREPASMHHTARRRPSPDVVAAAPPGSGLLNELIKPHRAPTETSDFRSITWPVARACASMDSKSADVGTEELAGEPAAP